MRNLTSTQPAASTRSEQIQLNELLGEGTFGKVYKVGAMFTHVVWWINYCLSQWMLLYYEHASKSCGEENLGYGS